MTDQALENALRKRDDLAANINKAQQQIEEWKRELTHTDSFISAWHQFAGTKSEDVPPIVGPIESDVLPPKRKNRNNSKKEDVAAEVRKLIEAAGHPIPRVDLYKALTEKGFVIEGTDPDMVLSTMLWRAGEAAGVKRLDKGGYWLLEADWPDAGYFPNEIAKLHDQMDAGGAFDDLLGHGEKPQGVFK